MSEAILKGFLSYNLWESEQIFDKFIEFSETNNLSFSFHQSPEKPKERFLFIEGKRPSKVVLIAHADTVWDKEYGGNETIQTVIKKDGYFVGQNNMIGIGADDRGGCAILWDLRNSGHSLLITDGEERGKRGSNYLINNFPEIVNKITKHQFLIQFDRRNSTDSKYYNVGTKNFKKFISHYAINFSDPLDPGSTDICVLCNKSKICGVNLSIGYYNEHTSDEKININEWKNTLEIVKKLIDSDKLPKFRLYFVQTKQLYKRVLDKLKKVINPKS